MVEEYLERKVKEALVENKLAAQSRPPVYYIPEEGGETYRKITGSTRQFLARNIKKNK